MRNQLFASDEYLDVPMVVSHLRVESPDPEELEYITVLVGAAVMTVSNDINRELFPSDKSPDPMTYPDAVAIDHALKVAILLLVGTWYENRESVAVGVSTQEMPLAYHMLIRPYRLLMSGF